MESLQEIQWEHGGTSKNCYEELIKASYFHLKNKNMLLPRFQCRCKKKGSSAFCLSDCGSQDSVGE